MSIHPSARKILLQPEKLQITYVQYRVATYLLGWSLTYNYVATMYCMCMNTIQLYTNAHAHKLCTLTAACVYRLYVCMNVSHRSKSKWEISPFSGKILCNEVSGDHHEIS